MPTLTAQHYFQVDHRADTAPSDPNLFSVGDVAAALLIDSTAISTATSRAVSSVNAAAPDSSSISTASSKATSAASVGSVADSKAVSVSGNTSVADSKALSGSVNTSKADSKATSVATYTVVPTVSGIPGFQQAGTGAALRVANLKMGDTVDVRDFGTVGDGVTDDTTAIQAAYTYLNGLGGGTVNFGPQTYLCGDLVTYANITTRGAGWKTKLKKKSGAIYLLSVNPGTGGTTDPLANASHIVVERLWMEGQSASGFVEGRHLLNLNAVTDVLVEGVKFTSYESDGIYLGSSNVSLTERHNRNVTIRKCHFDGVNYLNRNGIAVIDCDGLLVEDVVIENSGTTGEPGALCVEPDANAFAIIRNLTFRKIRVRNCPNVAGIALNLPNQTALTTPVSKILIEDFSFDNCSIGWVMTGQTASGGATATTPDYGITVRNGRVTTCVRQFAYDGAKGLTHEHVTYEDCTYYAELGYSVALCHDVLHRDITVRHCGTTSTDAWWIRSFDGLTIDGCHFDDNGLAGGAGGRHLHFLTGYSGARFVYRDNVFESPTSLTTYPVAVDAGFALTVTYGHDVNNTFVGGGSNDLIARLLPAQVISTTPTTIYTILNGYVATFEVLGDNGGGSLFLDRVVANQAAGTASATSSSTVTGSPPSRAYTISGALVKLALSTGYTIRVRPLNEFY